MDAPAFDFELLVQDAAAPVFAVQVSNHVAAFLDVMVTDQIVTSVIEHPLNAVFPANLLVLGCGAMDRMVLVFA